MNQKPNVNTASYTKGLQNKLAKSFTWAVVLKMYKEKLVETASRQDTLLNKYLDAHFNSDLEWGHFSFSREEVVTLKLINKTKRHLVEQNEGLVLNRINMATLFLSQT